jgi:eukaryotic-like serine/threonine-protein kinase
VEASLLADPPAPTNPLAMRGLRRKPGTAAPVREPAAIPAPATEPVRLLPRRLGRYHLFAHIGRGGMADIYLAQAETGLGDARRLVVIKEVLPRYAHSAEFAEMLVSEAKLAARLNHASVVKVEDLGRADGILFIAMEYVEGLDLRELLRRCAKNKVALPVEFSLRIVVEALRGLSFAHRARDDEGRRLGIVHRDVSPSNVLLSFEGEIKLCDFGIARANALADDLPEEAILGKAGYMSPEQARGASIDPRADVFSAGIILWELLAGRKLYKAVEGERLIDLARAAAIPALPCRDLPREDELHAIVARALRENPDERYPTAAAMLHDLEEYAAAARMAASQLRFGEWLMESFGQDVVSDRRARERVMRALARGPVTVIDVIEPAPRPEPDAESVAIPLLRSALHEPAEPSEYDATPSAFPVAMRAGGADPAGEASAPGPGAPLPETAIATATATEAPREGSRVLYYALVLLALACAGFFRFALLAR